MIGRGLNGSAIKYVQALSVVDTVNYAGEGAAIDCRDFQHGTLVVFATKAAGTTASVLRSATSDGTFSDIGASVAGVASGLAVRSFAMNSSAVWYKVGYRGPTSGSGGMAIGLVLQGARNVPVNQHSDTTVSSDVA